MLQSHVSDEEIVQRCLEGEPGAWDAFVDRYIRLVLFVIRKTFMSYQGRASQEDVEDVAMDLYAHLVANDYRVLRSLQNRARAKSWLAVSARRRAKDFLTKRSIPTVSLDQAVSNRPDASPLERLIGLTPQDGGNRLDDFRRLMDEISITPRERLLISLYFYQEKSYREIAGAVGISENTVGPAIRRALDHVKEELRQKGWES